MTTRETKEAKVVEVHYISYIILHVYVQVVFKVLVRTRRTLQFVIDICTMEFESRSGELSASTELKSEC